MEDLVVTARRLLPGVGVQVPPNLADWWPQLVAAGATDLGGLSANGDHISPEHPFPSPHQVRKRLQGDGVALTERLCVYPQYLDADWVAAGRPRRREGPLLDVHPAARLGPPGAALRDPRRARRPGGRARPRRRPAHRRGGHRAAVRDAPGGDRGDPRGRRRAARRARGRDGDLRRQPQHQRLERLRRGLRLLRLRPGQALARRLRALRGGVPPPRPRGRRPTARPSCACSPASTPTGAWRTTSAGCGWRATRPRAPGRPPPARLLADGGRPHVRRLRACRPTRSSRGCADAGLGSTPGTAAEVLHDGVRERISPNKLPVARWVEVIEASHRAGLRSTATVMFGHVEEPWELAVHMRVVRELQERTGGITEFVPLSFIPFQTLLGRTHGVEEISREENLKHTAVFRLALGRVDPEPAGLVGEDGPRRGHRGAALGRQRPRGDAHGGVHQPPGRQLPRRAPRPARAHRRRPRAPAARRPSARRSTTCARHWPRRGRTAAA